MKPQLINKRQVLVFAKKYTADFISEQMQLWECAFNIRRELLAKGVIRPKQVRK